MKLKNFFIITLAVIITGCNFTDEQEAKAPIMGWSSWNNFRINIDEQMIREQADAMISSGMYDAGYRYINVDDGYFGGRDANGVLFCDSTKFPSGMDALAEYIHSKGLKAGIYSDAGANTCASMWDDDSKGIGVGLYGFEKQDLTQYLVDWNYDFIKIDWCGGQKLQLDEESAYMNIIDIVRAIKPETVFNICRWQFPGEWAIEESDSWRVSGDIAANFNSILHIIDLNAPLSKYSSAGHYNDMDMLQVGRGMSYEEDKTHFSMWCMMNSPLLAGNDLRNMSKETIEILTNKEVIALNQDPAFIQAERVFQENGIEVWVKPLGNRNGVVSKTKKGVAIMNRGDSSVTYTLTPTLISSTNKVKVRDLWKHEDLGRLGEGMSFEIPSHGVIVLRLQ